MHAHGQSCPWPEFAPGQRIADWAELHKLQTKWEAGLTPAEHALTWEPDVDPIDHGIIKTCIVIAYAHTG